MAGGKSQAGGKALTALSRVVTWYLGQPGFARQARVDWIGMVKRWEGYGVYWLGEANSLYKSATARSIGDISMMRRAG